MALKPARLQWPENSALGDDSLRSLDFGDIYFQQESMAESRHVYLNGNRLSERFQEARTFHIAEMGFGTGLNFLLTADMWGKTAPLSHLYYAAIEKHPIEREDLARIYAAWPELKLFTDDILVQYPPMIEGFHHLYFPAARIHLTLLFGDAADMLPELVGNFDAWYLDGFAPPKNPDMWQDDLFKQIFAKTKAGGTLSSFTAVGQVRRGLKAAGFHVKKVKGFGKKWAMTVGYKPLTAHVPSKAREENIFILGAGLAGCSTARALAEKGRKVTVVDRRSSCAQEASGNPVGVLYPKLTVAVSPAGQFHSHGFCHTRTLLQVLPVPSWNACGVAHLDLNAEEAERSLALVERNGYPPDFAQVITQAYDVTGLNIPQSALYQPTAGCLSPAEFCAALLDHPNITTVFSSTVTHLNTFSGIVVIALGNASNIFPETAWLPLQSLRGQISMVADTAISRRLKTVVCHDGFITPSINGLHCVGATFQKESPENPILRDEDHAENLARLRRNIPILDLSTVAGGRAGYRATTPDRLPLIGSCPDYESFLRKENQSIEGLYITAGFGAHGLSGAPLAGEIIASFIVGDPLPVPQSLMRHLLPERFILRDLKRGKIR